MSSQAQKKMPKKKKDLSVAEKQDRRKKRNEMRKQKRAGAQNGKKKVATNTLGQEGVGVHGTDPRMMRFRRVNKQSNAAQTQDPTLNIEPSIPDSGLKYFALGLILAAKKRGWNGGNVAGHAFLAFRYLINALQSAFNGSIPQLATAPRWMWEILYALGPKAHSFKTSSAYYEASIVEGPPSVSTGQLSLGAAGTQYTVVLGSIGTAVFNGFNNVDPTTVYDADLAADAISSLWDCFPSEKGGPSELIGNPGEENVMLRYDVSAFAQCKQVFGTTYSGPGALVINALSEVHIDCPILAKFASSNPEESFPAWRVPHRINHNGGSTGYIGPRCTEFDRVSLFKNKAPAFAKFYNFDEFYEQASLILALGQESAARNTTQTVVPYPLTVQQFKVMLRQALLPIFNNEMAQDLSILPIGSQNSLLPMYPLVVGDNGYAPTAVSPLFPKFFVEMCRGCTRLTSQLASKFSDSNQYLDYIPVLARPPSIAELGNYNWKDAEDADHLLFKIPGPEVPMSIIDCKVVDAGTPYFLSLTGTELGNYVKSHNEWMTAMSANFSGLTTLVAAASTPLFATNCYTLLSRPINIIVNIAPNASAIASTPSTTTSTTTTPRVAPKLGKQSSQKKIPAPKGLVLERRKLGVSPVVGSSDFFSTYNQAMITSSIGFNREFTKYLDLLIVPTVYSINNESDSSASYIQAAYCEPASRTLQPNNVNDNTVNDLTSDTMYSKHFQAASLDVKAPGTGSTSEIDDLFATLTAKGEGSFLGGLARFLQVGGTVAGKLGQMLSD